MYFECPNIETALVDKVAKKRSAASFEEEEFGCADVG